MTQADNINEIRSHSSLIFNYNLMEKFRDMEYYMIRINQDPTQKGGTYLNSAYTYLFQIWRMIRPMVSNNVPVRTFLNLEVEGQKGFYTVDAMLGYIRKYFMDTKMEGKRLSIRAAFAIQELLNTIEVIIRQILQFWNFFTRWETQQKPDLYAAADSYMQNIDADTLQMLNEVSGIKMKLMDAEQDETTEDDDNEDDDEEEDT